MTLLYHADLSFKLSHSAEILDLSCHLSDCCSGLQLRCGMIKAWGHVSNPAADNLRCNHARRVMQCGQQSANNFQFRSATTTIR